LSLAPNDRFTREDLNAAFASQSANNTLGGVLSLAHSSSDTVTDVQGAINTLLETVPALNSFYVSFKKISVTLNSSSETTDLLGGVIPYAASSALNQAGALVLPPYNLCFLRRTNLGGWLSDASGRRVVGRIVTMTGGYRLTTYVRVGGSETTYSVGSAVVCDLWYPVVFSGANRPTYDDLFSAWGDNPVQELPDASTSRRGLMSADSQSFAGAKSFTNGLTVAQGFNASGFERSTITAATLTGSSALLTSTGSVVEVSGGVTSIGGISSNVSGTILTVINAQSGSIVFNAEDAGQASSDRIATAVTIAQNESVQFIYSGTISRWVRVGV